MSMLNDQSSRLYRSIEEPIRTGLSWNELWLGPDNGLIKCWERGRQYADESPETGDAAKRGELVPNWWRGGVEKKLKNDVVKKDGTIQYLATWLGMRGEDLDIEINSTRTLSCSRTGQTVEYHPFSQARENGDEAVS